MEQSGASGCHRIVGGVVWWSSLVVDILVHGGTTLVGCAHTLHSQSLHPLLLHRNDILTNISSTH